MSKAKKNKALRSTRQLMGVDSVTDFSLQTAQGELVFFLLRPTNLGVLPDKSVTERIHALLNLLKSCPELELLALNSRESFARNKSYYQKRLAEEPLPALRRLLEQDGDALDRMQAQMASSREFCVILRLRERTDASIFSLITNTEQSIAKSGFSSRRATGQELKQLLAVYYEQNVTTEVFEDMDGVGQVKRLEKERMPHA